MLSGIQGQVVSVNHIIMVRFKYNAYFYTIKSIVQCNQ